MASSRCIAILVVGLGLLGLESQAKPSYLNCNTYPSWKPDSSLSTSNKGKKKGYMGLTTYEDGGARNTGNCVLGITTWDVNDDLNSLINNDGKSTTWEVNEYNLGAAYVVSLSSTKELGHKLKVTAGTLLSVPSGIQTENHKNDPNMCAHTALGTDGPEGGLKRERTQFLWIAPDEKLGKKVQFYAVCGSMLPDAEIYAARPQSAKGPDPCPDYVTSKDCKSKKKGRKKGCTWTDTSTCDGGSGSECSVFTKSKGCKKAKKKGCLWNPSGSCSNRCFDPAFEDVVCADLVGKAACNAGMVCKYKKKKCLSKCG